MDGWVSALINGTQTGSDVAYGFVFSREFLNKNTTNEEIIARWQGKPAPFLGILHDFMARDGVINDKAMGAVGKVIGKSPGALGVLLSSYPVFPRIGGLRPSPPPAAPVAAGYGTVKAHGADHAPPSSEESMAWTRNS